MKKVFIICLMIIISYSFISCEKKAALKKSEFGIVIHGGAGTILKSNMTEEKETEYKVKMEEALLAGYEVLKNNGTSLDAIQKAINIMEDSPLFNAGKGAVFTGEGKNELDASIMDGKSLNAGAVAGVKHIKNPITLARLVMEKSKHVFMARDGAEVFAKQQGVELVPEDYFFTKRRWDSLKRSQEKEKQKEQTSLLHRPDEKFGTVGAAALDKSGNLAAGTSTGGMTNKKFGRIGDSPVIGAGTYANNNTCAVSATGHGEYFIRSVVSYDIAALMDYRGLPLKDAADKVIMEKLTKLGGTGGIIAMDKDGNIAMPFNTEGMYRGFILDDGKPVIKIYKE